MSRPDVGDGKHLSPVGKGQMPGGRSWLRWTLECEDSQARATGNRMNQVLAEKKS